jgi:hypothetical protein
MGRFIPALVTLMSNSDQTQLWAALHNARKKGTTARPKMKSKVMRTSMEREYNDVFDQTQIDKIERVLDRAWDVITKSDAIEVSDDGARKLLALCVMGEARSGEENHIRLINQSIVQFRLQRAKHKSAKRQRLSLAG